MLIRLQGIRAFSWCLYGKIQMNQVVRSPEIMGVVNVTPDSFSDGGQFFDAQAAIDHGLRLEDEGADILDIGGESTRPGSDTVSVDDELKRVLPVIEGLKGRVNAKISLDTRKAEVMRQGVEAGVDIINDVSALTYDEDSLAVAAGSGLPVVLMHAQGDPKTMQVEPRYEDVTGEIYDYLRTRISVCNEAGISNDRIIVDPGIGFGKRLEHNLEIIRNLKAFQTLGVPLLFGASRKSMISMISGEKDPMKRLPGSLALAVKAMDGGAAIIRVHDVAETRQALAVWEACG